MSTFEIARYRIGAGAEDELRRRWRDAVAAMRRTFPGLVQANLTRIDSENWIDVWQWETREAALAAAEGAPRVAEAAALFSLIVAPPEMTHGEIVETA